MATVEETIRQKLEAALSPTFLTVKNESHLHAGHAGAPAEGDAGHGASHFRILVVAEVFEGQSRVIRQRSVNEILSAELSGPVHALAMKTLTPGEYESIQVDDA